MTTINDTFATSSTSSSTNTSIISMTEDPDQCSLGTHTCHVEATCTDTDHGFDCRCNFGFSGDGYNCDDVNECGAESPCSMFSECVNHPGGYSCQCKAGFACE